MRSSTSIGEMEYPDTSADGIIPSEVNKSTRTKVESHVYAASVGKRDIVGEGKQTTIDVEEGLPTPRVARGKLQADGATAAVGVADRPTPVEGVWAAIGNVSGINCERLEIQIAANE